MASVNDLILESNVRERLYPAMPFKILQIYMKTANRYAYASCFSGNIFPKRKRISGPQYISCQKKATGKFMKVVWSHTATNWEPAFLNKIVAIKLMIGHIMQMIITEIATVMAKGPVFRCDNTKSKLMGKVINNKELQYKCNRPHNLHFAESHEKYLVAHSTDVQGNVVADHGVDHKESHHQSENNILKLSFWHKIVLLFLKMGTKKTHVLFVIKCTLVSFPILYQS